MIPKPSDDGTKTSVERVVDESRKHEVTLVLEQARELLLLYDLTGPPGLLAVMIRGGRWTEMLAIKWVAWTIRTRNRPPKPDLTGIKHFADCFSLDLRKRITGMAADYEVEINRIFAEGRFKTARWNKAMAWAYAIGYVLRGPFDFLYWCGQKLMKLVYGR